jgi:hypothetical protein
MITTLPSRKAIFKHRRFNFLIILLYLPANIDMLKQAAALQRTINLQLQSSLLMQPMPDGHPLERAAALYRVEKRYTPVDLKRAPVKPPAVMLPYTSCFPRAESMPELMQLYTKAVQKRLALATLE